MPGKFAVKLAMLVCFGCIGSLHALELRTGQEADGKIMVRWDTARGLVDTLQMSGDLATWQTTNVSFYGTGGPCAVHVDTAALPDQPPPSQPSSLPRTLCHFFWITTFVDASGKAVIGTRDPDGNVWQVQVAANFKGIEEDFLGSFALGPAGLNKVVNSVVHPVVLMGNITDWRGADPYQPVVPLSTVPAETQQWIQTIVSRAAEIRAQRNARAAAVASAPLTENPPGPKMYFRVVRSRVDSDFDSLWDDEEWAQGNNAFLADSNYDGITDAQAAGKGHLVDSDGDGLVDDEDAVPMDPLLMFPRVPESRYALIDLGPGTAYALNASGQVLRAWEEEPGVPGSPKQVVVTATLGSTTAIIPVPHASEIEALVGLSDEGKAFYLRRTEVTIPDYGNAGQSAQESIHSRLWRSLNGNASPIFEAGTPFPPPSYGPWTTTQLFATGPVTAAGSVFNGIQNGEARATDLGQPLNSGVDVGSSYEGSPIWWNPGGIPMIEGVFWNYYIQATPESPAVAGNHPIIQPNSQQSVYATWPAVSREGDAVLEEFYNAYPVPNPVGAQPRRHFFYRGLDGPQPSHEPIGNFEGAALAVSSIPTLAGHSMGPLVISRLDNTAKVYVRTPSGWQSTNLPQGDGSSAMPLGNFPDHHPAPFGRFATAVNARGEFLYGETLWRNGRAHDLNNLLHLPPNPDGSPTSFIASDLNSSGLICGTHFTANGPRAALLIPVEIKQPKVYPDGSYGPEPVSVNKVHLCRWNSPRDSWGDLENVSEFPRADPDRIIFTIPLPHKAGQGPLTIHVSTHGAQGTPGGTSGADLYNDAGADLQLVESVPGVFESKPIVLVADRDDDKWAGGRVAQDGALNDPTFMEWPGGKLKITVPVLNNAIIDFPIKKFSHSFTCYKVIAGDLAGDSVSLTSIHENMWRFQEIYASMHERVDLPAAQPALISQSDLHAIFDSNPALSDSETIALITKIDTLGLPAESIMVVFVSKPVTRGDLRGQNLIAFGRDDIVLCFLSKIATPSGGAPFYDSFAKKYGVTVAHECGHTLRGIDHVVIGGIFPPAMVPGSPTPLPGWHLMADGLTSNHIYPGNPVKSGKHWNLVDEEIVHKARKIKYSKKIP